MSIREEIRNALLKMPASVDELLPQVPSCEGDRTRLALNIAALVTKKMLRRAGLTDDKRVMYQLDPDVWPAAKLRTLGATGDDDADAAPPPKRTAKSASITEAKERWAKQAQEAARTKKTSAAKTPSPPKAQRPAAKPARKTAAEKPAAKRTRQPAAALHVKPKQALVRQVLQADEHVVGLLHDGAVFVLDKHDGTYSTIPPAVVRQILLFADRQRPALAA